MIESNYFQNEPFSLGNDPRIDDLITILFGEEFTTLPFEVLIQMDISKFETKFNSVSKFYRTLSNSNQTVGVRSPVSHNTNRKWWSYHFSGGKYTTYKCNDIISIHFKLDCNPNAYTPSEIQIKMRIIKALKFKPTILTGCNKPSIIHHLSLLEDCFIETQEIGSRYGNKQNLKGSNSTEEDKQIGG
jgi:hypothetical protein